MKVPKVEATSNSELNQGITYKLINLETISKCVSEFIDYNNEKEYKKYIKSIEKIIRGSNEYRKYIKYLKQEIELTNCNFFTNIDISEIKGVSIEFHHYPFTLYDVVDITIRRLSDKFTKQVTQFDVAEEVMMMHFKNEIPLVPLSKTVHDLAHTGDVFINLNDVFGDLNLFEKKYSEHINEDLKVKINVLKNLSNELGYDIEDNKILDKSFQFILGRGFELVKFEDDTQHQIA